MFAPQISYLQLFLTHQILRWEWPAKINRRRSPSLLRVGALLKPVTEDKPGESWIRWPPRTPRCLSCPAPLQVRPGRKARHRHCSRSQAEPCSSLPQARAEPRSPWQPPERRRRPEPGGKRGSGGVTSRRWRRGVGPGLWKGGKEVGGGGLELQREEAPVPSR